MAIIPIVISFNDNFIIPAGVFLTSLCKNAGSETRYIVYVLHSEDRLKEKNRKKIKELESHFSNLSIYFKNVDRAFSGAYEVRNVTIDSYYRLLIPKLFTDYDRILYIDVDTIINSDLKDLINKDLKGYSLAAVPEFVVESNSNQNRYIKSLSLDPNQYFNAGVLLFNLAHIRNNINAYLNQINSLSKKNLLYQDQDILNILFKNNCLNLPHKYNYTYSKLEEGLKLSNPSIIHYTLDKPWIIPRPFGNVWWNYYSLSEFYDETYYLDFQLRAYKNTDTLYKLNKIFKRLGFYKLVDLRRLILSHFRKM
ncbi:MAG: glycosyltransferase family 8 protein [Carboxylicivirga sp.]|jgi:lipopolysaccharide biosynthesis glycosyltransferase|nr:glycosyltransferase family 8 protein [Carboxylicivirga sp.]